MFFQKCEGVEAPGAPKKLTITIIIFVLFGRAGSQITLLSYRGDAPLMEELFLINICDEIMPQTKNYFYTLKNKIK